MKILCIGDVVGRPGTDTLKVLLPRVKSQHKIDLCIVNGENSADQNGITVHSAEEIFSAGADVITGGNHTLRHREIFDMLESNPFLLRPANFPSTVHGTGYCRVDMGRTSVGVINICGVVYMEALDNPFFCADRMIERAKADGCNIIILDFHAEATSEKRAFGFYVDGQVSALFGTHTHIQTADEQILPCGTGYITDVGMTGPYDSVLGVRKEIIINRMKNKISERFQNERNGKMCLNGVIFDIDEKSGKTLSVERVAEYTEGERK